MDTMYRAVMGDFPPATTSMSRDYFQMKHKESRAKRTFYLLITFSWQLEILVTAHHMSGVGNCNIPS